MEKTQQMSRSWVHKYEPVIFDMDSFYRKKVPCTKYQTSGITQCLFWAVWLATSRRLWIVGEWLWGEMDQRWGCPSKNAGYIHNIKGSGSLLRKKQTQKESKDIKLFFFLYVINSCYFQKIVFWKPTAWWPLKGPADMKIYSIGKQLLQYDLNIYCMGTAYS